MPFPPALGHRLHRFHSSCLPPLWSPFLRVITTGDHVFHSRRNAQKSYPPQGSPPTVPTIPPSSPSEMEGFSAALSSFPTTNYRPVPFSTINRPVAPFFPLLCPCHSAGTTISFKWTTTFFNTRRKTHFSEALFIRAWNFPPFS